jgi:hypothetical protein
MEYLQIRAGDLWPMLYESDGHVIQRRESAKRVQDLAAMWDESLVGSLHVAVLKDGEHAEQMHTYEGGTRLRVKMDKEVVDNIDPDYRFDCLVEHLTVREVAHRFLGMSKGRKAVPKLDEFNIALTDEVDWAMQVQAAIEMHNLRADRFPRLPNGGPGSLAAVAAAEAVVRAATKDGIDPVGHLGNVLSITLAGFPKSTSIVDSASTYGLDGDLLRAVSALTLRNADKFYGEKTVGPTQRLIETLQSQTPAMWKASSGALSLERGKSPGSAGRPAYLDYTIADRYNRRLRGDSRISAPRTIVRILEGA